MNIKQLSAVIDGIAPVIKRLVADSTEPLELRVKAIEGANEFDVAAHVDALVAEHISKLVAPAKALDEDNDIEQFADCLVKRFASESVCG